MRNDGTVTYYAIEVFLDRSNKWANANLDHFGCPKDFTASGECWQQTGFHGTFDRNVGLSAVQEIAGRNHGHSFRLIRRTMVRETTVVSTSNSRNKT